MYKKFEDYNFRELDRKIVLVKSVENKFDNYGIENLENPFLGYLYIDADCGFRLRILGNENNQMMIKEYCNESIVLVSNDCFKNMEFKIYDKEINTYDLEKQIDNYYMHNELNETRMIEEVDDLRNARYPDDVQVLIPFKDKNELLWGKLVGVSEIEKLFIVCIITDSYYLDELKVGTFIACKLETIKDKKYLVIEAIVERK